MHNVHHWNCFKNTVNINVNLIVAIIWQTVFRSMKDYTSAQFSSWQANPNNKPPLTSLKILLLWENGLGWLFFFSIGNMGWTWGIMWLLPTFHMVWKYLAVCLCCGIRTSPCSPVKLSLCSFYFLSLDGTVLSWAGLSVEGFSPWKESKEDGGSHVILEACLPQCVSVWGSVRVEIGLIMPFGLFVCWSPVNLPVLSVG